MHHKVIVIIRKIDLDQANNEIQLMCNKLTCRPNVLVLLLYTALGIEKQ